MKIWDHNIWRQSLIIIMCRTIINWFNNIKNLNSGFLEYMSVKRAPSDRRYPQIVYMCCMCAYFPYYTVCPRAICFLVPSLWIFSACADCNKRRKADSSRSPVTGIRWKSSHVTLISIGFGFYFPGQCSSWSLITRPVGRRALMHKHPWQQKKKFWAEFEERISLLYAIYIQSYISNALPYLIFAENWPLNTVSLLYFRILAERSLLVPSQYL
jgi:hypothetical protein